MPRYTAPSDTSECESYSHENRCTEKSSLPLENAYYKRNTMFTEEALKTFREDSANNKQIFEGRNRHAEDTKYTLESAEAPNEIAEDIPLLSFILKWKFKSNKHWNRSEEAFVIQDGIFFGDNFKPFDLNSFRDYLYYSFGVHQMSRISYLDDDGDQVPIDSQCEFLEAWKFARMYSKEDKSVTLIVEIDPDAIYFSPPSSKKKTPLKSKASSHRTKISTSGMQNSPPIWFQDYMEKMKNDIVMEISDKMATTLKETLSDLQLNFSPKSNDSHKRPSYNNYKNTNSYERSNYNGCNLNSEEHKERRGSVQRSSTPNSSKQANSQFFNTVNKVQTDEIDNGGSISKTECNSKKEKEKGKNEDCDKILSETQQFLNNIPILNFQNSDKKDDCIACLLDNVNIKNLNLTERVVKNKSVLDQSYGFKNTEQEQTLCDSRCSESILCKSHNPKEPTMKQNDTCSDKAPSAQETLLNPHDKPDIPHHVDNEFRMNCSVTGHQMLDNDNLSTVNAGCMLSSASDSNNISTFSDVSNVPSVEESSDEPDFEIIPPPEDCYEKGESDKIPVIDASNYEEIIFDLTDFADLEILEDNNENNRDSPSFELLSDISSPPVSIYMDEDHFSVQENNNCIPESTELSEPTTVLNYPFCYNVIDNDTNLSEKIDPLIIDINGKVHSGYESNQTLLKDGNLDNNVLPRQSGGTYSFTAETLKAQTKENMSRGTAKSTQTSHQYSKMNDPISDIKSCNTSFILPDSPQQNCESRRNMSCDFSQSFHSHTTSITNNNVYSSDHGAYDNISDKSSQHSFEDQNKNNESIESNSSQQKDKSEKRGIKKNIKVKVSLGKIRQERKTDHSKTTHENTSDSQKPNNSAFRMFDDSDFMNTDPVHILPETIVSGTALMASMAKGVFDKIRAHATYSMNNM